MAIYSFSGGYGVTQDFMYALAMSVCITGLYILSREQRWGYSTYDLRSELTGLEYRYDMGDSNISARYPKT